MPGIGSLSLKLRTYSSTYVEFCCLSLLLYTCSKPLKRFAFALSSSASVNPNSFALSVSLIRVAKDSFSRPSLLITIVVQAFLDFETK